MVSNVLNSLFSILLTNESQPDKISLDALAGHIARLAGHPAHSRMVGQALKFLQDETVPWQRVIGASGAISERGDGGIGAARQATRLREG